MKLTKSDQSKRLTEKTEGKKTKYTGSLLLAVIYLAFISLGLPDSLLGTAWPLMHHEIRAPFGYAGVVFMIVAISSILSSLLSGILIPRLGTGKLTIISCCMTAGALLGFSLANSITWIALLAIPLGLGAGAVDSALNHYVAENYKARHLNWLHSFWGIGATAGPAVLSYFIAVHNSWRPGYLTIAIIQFFIAFLLFISLPLWASNSIAVEHYKNKMYKLPGQIGGMKGLIYTLIAFLFYCGVEVTVGLWGASYLVNTKHASAEIAASCIAIYYGGITFGRFISGFITMKVPNRLIIRCSLLIAVLGAIIIALPLPLVFHALGFILMGLGFAPVYPTLIYETPARFGSENSAKLIGYQMAAAYIGITFFPPFFGVFASQVNIALFAPFVLVCIMLVLISTERVNRALSV